MKKTTEILVKAFLIIIAIGARGLIAAYIYWPAEIQYKIDLLRSLLVASVALVGFTTTFLFKTVSEGERFIKEKGISTGRMKNLRIFLSWSVITGFLAILAILFYFVSYEMLLIMLSWVLFVIQLELFVLPFIFTRIIAFR